MKTYSRYLNTKQIDNISLFAALVEYYISHDNRLKEDVKKKSFRN